MLADTSSTTVLAAGRLLAVLPNRLGQQTGRQETGGEADWEADGTYTGQSQMDLLRTPLSMLKIRISSFSIETKELVKTCLSRESIP